MISIWTVIENLEELTRNTFMQISPFGVLYRDLAFDPCTTSRFWIQSLYELL